MEINSISIGVATCIITDRAKNNEIKHASILHNLIHVKIKIQLNNNLSDNYIYTCKFTSWFTVDQFAFAIV